jgi:hypothetical protein
LPQINGCFVTCPLFIGDHYVSLIPTTNRGLVLATGRIIVSNCRGGSPAFGSSFAIDCRFSAAEMPCTLPASCLGITNIHVRTSTLLEIRHCQNLPLFMSSSPMFGLLPYHNQIKAGNVVRRITRFKSQERIQPTPVACLSLRKTIPRSVPNQTLCSFQVSPSMPARTSKIGSTRPMS